MLEIGRRRITGDGIFSPLGLGQAPERMSRRRCATQALDEHVVPPSPFTVHADRNAVGGEHAGEGRASELRALVGIEDLRLAVTSHSILQRLNAERRGIPPRPCRSSVMDELAENQSYGAAVYFALEALSGIAHDVAVL
jgi:hypothetical protein